MTSPQPKYVDPAVTAASAIRYAVGARFESWVLKWLHSELDFFLAGAEKAEVDCGLWLREGGEAAGDFTLRLHTTVHENREQEEMVALDCKTISPVLSQTFKGGLYHYEIYRTEAEQKACAGFIVHNPAAPDHVALIPTTCLERTVSNTPQQRFTGRDIPLTGLPTEPFPLEWSPYVMPLDCLPTALKQLRSFALDLQSTW